MLVRTTCRTTRLGERRWMRKIRIAVGHGSVLLCTCEHVTTPSKIRLNFLFCSCMVGSCRLSRDREGTARNGN